MKTATVRPVWDSRIGAERQSGIALLQVLLISAIISLLAIRFTHTARDQIDIAERFEARIKAQLMVNSVINELIFFQLSDSVEMRSGIDSRPVNPALLNSYGKPIEWAEGTTVSIQDLSGLLPQWYPEHPLWRRLLTRRGIDDYSINRYLGVWQDFQDSDDRSWIVGDKEPSRLPTGQSYLNGYFQNDKPLTWIFWDRPALANDLRRLSNPRASYETNLLNAPDALLLSLFDPDIAYAVQSLRRQGVSEKGQVQAILPKAITGAHLGYKDSSLISLDVHVINALASWREKRLIKLGSNGLMPFKIMLIE